MLELANTTEQLQAEIMNLRQENQSLAAQLAFHRKVFREVHHALGFAGEVSTSLEKNEPLRQLLTENERLKNQMKLFRLSEREREILKYIVLGFTSKEIATHLRISKLTVDTHRKHIQQKLDVPNTVELIKLAMQFDLT